MIWMESNLDVWRQSQTIPPQSSCTKVCLLVRPCGRLCIARLPLSQAEHKMNKGARCFPRSLVLHHFSRMIPIGSASKLLLFNLFKEKMHDKQLTMQKLRFSDLHPPLVVHVHGCGHRGRLLHECQNLGGSC